MPDIKTKRGVASLIGRPLLVGALAAGGVASSGTALAADDIFLKLDGFTGESVDAKHKGEIDILFYSQLFSNSSTAAGGGTGAGKVICGDITVQKTVDSSTPQFINGVTRGEHIKQGVVTFRQAGGAKREYFVVTINDVLVNSLQQTDALPDKILEKITLSASKFEFKYRSIDAKGAVGPWLQSGYDCKSSKAL